MRDRIKQLCKERKITLKEVAEHMEITPESLTRAISGKRNKPANPTLKTFKGIAAALDVEPYELFTDTDGKQPLTNVHGTIWIAGKPTIINSMEELQDLVNLYSIGRKQNGAD